MDVEVNEENIDLFALAKLTGNTREEMLSQAADAAEAGYILSVNIPDTELHHNVFENYVATVVGGQENVRCRYELKDTIIGQIWTCIIHMHASKHNVDEASDKPCLKIDPVNSEDT